MEKYHMLFFKGFSDVEVLKNLPREEAIAAYNRQFFRRIWHWRSIIYLIFLLLAARMGNWLDGNVNGILFGPVFVFVVTTLWGRDVHRRVNDGYSKEM